VNAKGNPMIQVRLHPEIIKKVEQRARALGFITPSDKANLADYVRSLIMRDVNSNNEHLIDEPENYSVK
jgi:hypothetical protein